MSDGKLSTCPACPPQTTARGRRLKPGLLRPDILLYGEPDSRADPITQIIQHDLSLDIDLLLIFGTSLTVHGSRELAKSFARLVRQNKGKVLFINREEPARSDWGGVIDYWVDLDSDVWVCDVKRRHPRFCSPSTPGGSDLLTTTVEHGEGNISRAREHVPICGIWGVGAKKRLAPPSDHPVKRVKMHLPGGIKKT
ncbi:hypothetical protein F5B22DRAFT_644193 [Xylaria bambusicola]|uniref:uncharacterized protein n=1 Tax=Xylaria bambusicola TaxID=326684 RepID=UPI0020073C7A|nr:uncharacterized protein F5B22DRAFT_644193 [Xylaria bambusicola]KAI0520950.1 hypothetical protein F5B22DRAFT_644193 [Xylaria bambusicola]